MQTSQIRSISADVNQSATRGTISREQNNNHVISNGLPQTNRLAPQATIRSANSNVIEINSKPPIQFLKSSAIAANVFEGTLGYRKVAVKTGDKNKIDRELKHLLDLEHPNIVQILFSVDDNGKNYLITELYKHPLRDHIKLQVPIKFIIGQLSSTVVHMQEKKIVHLDIAPDNIFLNKSDSGVVVKLTNFEHALKITSESVRVSSFNSNNMKSGFTPYEVYEHLLAFNSSDSWSLGYVLISLMTERGCMKRAQRNAVKSENLYEAAVINSTINAIKNDKNENILCKDLLNKFLTDKINMRITAKEAMQHPFFWSAQQTLYFIVEIASMIESSQKYGGSFHNEIFEGSGKVIGVGRGGEWTNKIPNNLLEEIKKSREAFGKNQKVAVKIDVFDRTTITSLIKTIRNMKVHARSPEVSAIVGNDDETFLNYWIERFPLLIMHLHEAKRKYENKEN